MLRTAAFHEGHDLAFDHGAFVRDAGAADEDGLDVTWALDNVELTTVGVDVGSSTSHLLFARLHLQRRTQSLSSRFVVVQRQVLHRTPILLTPYRADGLIDVQALETFVHQAYADAGLTPAAPPSSGPTLARWPSYSPTTAESSFARRPATTWKASWPRMARHGISWLRDQLPHVDVPAKDLQEGASHGPGRAIVIPAGEGYSVMWEEGKDKVVAPWQPGALITPPNRWFHQHFNVGQQPARYLAFHPPMQFDGHAEKVEDRAKDQIEYVDENPAVRERFEAELAKRGMRSEIPDAAYLERDFEWTPVRL